MTVYVSKPVFNLREKVSELDRPVGNHGSQLMKSHDVVESFDLVRAARKNILINGDMRIWQRGSSIASPAATGKIYGPDHWMFEEGCTQLVATLSRSTDVPYDQGFEYSAQLNVDTPESAIDSSDFAQYMYFAEGNDVSHLRWGTNYAKPVTLSFWFKTTLAGWHYVSFNSENGVDTYGASIYSPANAWKKHVVTVTPPEQGTWVQGNGRGLMIRIGLMNSANVAQSAWNKWYHGGAAYNGFATAHSKLMLTSGNKAWITGAQLEEGTVATPFEFRPFQSELELCMRYFQKSFMYADSPGTAAHQGGVHVVSWADGNAAGLVLPVRMRDAGTWKLWPTNSTNEGKVSSYGTERDAVITYPGETGYSFIAITSGTANTYVRFQYSVDAEFT